MVVGTDGARFEVIDSHAVSTCWLLASVSKTLLRQRLFKVSFDTGFDSFVSDQRLVVSFVCDIILEASTIRQNLLIETIIGIIIMRLTCRHRSSFIVYHNYVITVAGGSRFEMMYQPLVVRQVAYSDFLMLCHQMA